MKKRTIYSWMLCLSLLAGSVTLNSCRDEFTEEQALKAQQTLDFSVVAYDAFENKGVAGASVTIIHEGKEMKQTTNESGVAIFPGVKIGTIVPVKIESADFATSQADFNIRPESYRDSQYTGRVHMFSIKEGGANLAIIKGKAEVETDLTNEAPEFPAGKKVTAVVRVNENGNLTVISREVAISDKGTYSLTVPAIADGLTYQLVFQTFEADQKIAKNGDRFDAGMPVVKPSIATIKTTFASGVRKEIPSVRPVFAVIPAPDGTDANIIKKQALANVNVSSVSGKVSGISFTNFGAGYLPNTEYTFAIESLMGGSGAEVKLMTNASGSFSDYAFGHTVLAEKGGSGYPTVTNINKVYAGDLGLPGEITVRPGQIHVRDASYSTGVARDGAEIR